MLAHALSNLSQDLPRPFDAAMAARCRDDWNAAARTCDDAPDRAAWMTAFAAAPKGGALLDALTGNSPYLAQIVLREPEWLRRFAEDGPDAAFAALMADLDGDIGPDAPTDTLMRRLRETKRRAALLIAAADITGLWDVAQVTGALTTVAEIGLRLAADHLLGQAAKAGRLTLPDPANPSRGSGLIILAMGKMGARELNYSSDIDIIVLYDEAVARTPQPDRLGQTFIKLTRDLVRIMDERTRDGYVFRTDLRLRPDPAATPPAVSVAAAEIYYASVGQNWERAAMIKARAVAGDLEAGQAFLTYLRPFVWRRNLDFAAIQDIHSIKRQINAHKGHRSICVNGHDIKVGRGGIREIEFFAQTQQLIFGGRDASVRVRPTLAALQALHAGQRIPAHTVEQLTVAYNFLRRVEHRIQMIDDQQTHRVPASDDGVAHLATFLGYADPAAFREALLAHLGTVEDRYAELFEEAPPLAPAGNLVFTGAEDDPETLTTLSEMGFADASRTISVVAGWHRGRYRSTRSPRARELLTELAPSLLHELAATPAPDTALINLDEFLARLPAGVPVFSLFKANPWLMTLVAEIMGGAPRLAATLSRHPALLDAVLAPGFFEYLADREALERDYRRAMARLSDGETLEDALTIARRWTNDHRFQAGAQMLRHLADGITTGPFLADLAEVALADIAHRVEKEFAARHGFFHRDDFHRDDGQRGSWVIVAMGKLGSRQLTVSSDIDLIVIYDTPEGVTASDGARPLSPPEYYGRLTQRLTTAITAPMADGRLYEVDMRLRPSGNAGPLATSLAAFTAYQRNDAWTWEHMALTRARVVVGDSELAGRVSQVIRQTLRVPRDPTRLLADVADMRRRIDGEFPASSVWNLKYARGGLIDIEFIAQYLQLRHGHGLPEVLSVDMTETIERAASRHLLPDEAAEALLSAFDVWRRLQGYLRLTGEEAPTADHLPPGIFHGLAQAAFPGMPLPVDFAALENQLAAVAAGAYRWFREIIEKPAAALATPSAPAQAPASSSNT